MNLNEIGNKYVEHVRKGTTRRDLEIFLAKIPEQDLMKFKKRMEDTGMCKKTNTVKDFHNELYYSIPKQYKRRQTNSGYSGLLQLNNVKLCSDKYNMAIPRSKGTYSGTVYDIDNIKVQGNKRLKLAGKESILAVQQMNVLSHNGIIAVSDGKKYAYTVHGMPTISETLPETNEFLTVHDIYCMAMNIIYDSIDITTVNIGEDADVSLVAKDDFEEVCIGMYVNMHGLTEEFSRSNFLRCVSYIKSIAETLFGNGANNVLNKIKFIMPELYDLQPDIEDDFCYYYK